MDYSLVAKGLAQLHEAMSRATQDHPRRTEQWRVLTKRGPLEERMANNPSILRGNGKPLQYPCLENAMKSMKRQKDITLEDEGPPPPASPPRPRPGPVCY